MNPSNGDPADRGSIPGPSTRDGKPGNALEDEGRERLRRTTRLRTAFVLILTGAVVLFALAIIVWMYMLSGQMPADPVSVT